MSSIKPIVFHIAKWYPHKHDNLSGIFVKRHILSTLPYTTPVLLYAMASAETKRWYEIEETEEEGIVSYRCYYRKKITGISLLDKWMKLILYFLVLLKLYRRAKEKIGKPALIHTHVLLRTAAIAYLIGLVERIPYLLLEHATRFTREDIAPFNHRVERWLTRFVIHKSAGLIAVSQSLGKCIVRKSGLRKEFDVVYNCVDTSIFRPTHSPKQKNKAFVYVAEFDEKHKNISGLLRVIDALRRKRTDFIVHLVGYGKDEDRLKKYALDLGLLNTVVFFEGKKTGKALAAYIVQSEALLLFSNYENLPCVITEAFCCGIPVISTDVGGIAEIVSPQHGILVDKADEEAMLNAMHRVLADEIRFDQEYIKSNAYALFSNEAIGMKLAGIYKRVLAC
jgi:glycosyltransferase involved in cell wall biosynthesis